MVLYQEKQVALLSTLGSEFERKHAHIGNGMYIYFWWRLLHKTHCTKQETMVSARWRPGTGQARPTAKRQRWCLLKSTKQQTHPPTGTLVLAKKYARLLAIASTILWVEQTEKCS